MMRSGTIHCLVSAVIQRKDVRFKAGSITSGPMVGTVTRSSKLPRLHSCWVLPGMVVEAVAALAQHLVAAAAAVGMEPLLLTSHP